MAEPTDSVLLNDLNRGSRVAVLGGELKRNRSGVIGVDRFWDHVFGIYVHLQNIGAISEIVDLNELAGNLGSVLIFPTYR
jgi:hypothetical protein